MSKRTILAVAIAVVALAIAACDGSDGDPTPTAGGESTATAEPTNAAGDPTATGAAAGAIELTWWGQAMFVLQSPDGTRVLLDPYGDIGYRLPEPDELAVDVVTVSHEHFDHNNIALAGDTVTVLRGLTADGYAEVDEAVEDVAIRAVPSFHDDSDGADRGRNAIFVFDAGGMTIVHLGDLGHTLSDEQIALVGEVDVVLVPTGGFFTIDAAAATEVVAQLGPRLVIPMHYATPANAVAQLATVDAFLEGKDVGRFGSTVELSGEALPDPGEAVVWVLEPAGG